MSTLSELLVAPTQQVTDPVESRGLRNAAINKAATESPFLSTLAGTLQGTVGGGSLTALGNVTGALGLKRASDALYAKGAQLQADAAPYMAPQLDYTTVKDVGSAWDFAKANAAQGVGSMATMIAGRYLGGAPLGLAAGYLPQHGENVSRIKDDAALAGMSEARMLGAAAPTAALQTGLDYIVPGGVATSLARRGAAAMGTGALGKAGATLGTNMLLEGGAELGQEELGMGMHTLLNPNRDTSGDEHARIQSFLGGAVGGAPMGAIDAGMGVLQDKVDAKPPKPLDISAESDGILKSRKPLHPNLTDTEMGEALTQRDAQESAQAEQLAQKVKAESQSPRAQKLADEFLAGDKSGPAAEAFVREVKNADGVEKWRVNAREGGEFVRNLVLHGVTKLKGRLGNAQYKVSNKDLHSAYLDSARRKEEASIIDNLMLSYRSSDISKRAAAQAKAAMQINDIAEPLNKWIELNFGADFNDGEVVVPPQMLKLSDKLDVFVQTLYNNKVRRGEPVPSPEMLQAVITKINALETAPKYGVDAPQGEQEFDDSNAFESSQQNLDGQTNEIDPGELVTDKVTHWARTNNFGSTYSGPDGDKYATKAMAELQTRYPGAQVERVGVATAMLDELKNKSPEDRRKAENLILEQYSGVAPENMQRLLEADDDTRRNFLKKIDLEHEVLRTTAFDTNDSLEIPGEEFDLVTNNRWVAQVEFGDKDGKRVRKDTASDGVLYFQPTKQVRGKNAAPMPIRTSTLMKHARMAGEEATSPAEMHDALITGVSAVIDSYKRNPTQPKLDYGKTSGYEKDHVMLPQVGFRTTPNGPITWVESGEQLPQELALFKGTSVADVAASKAERRKAGDPTRQNVDYAETTIEKAAALKKYAENLRTWGKKQMLLFRPAGLRMWLEEVVTPQRLREDIQKALRSGKVGDVSKTTERKYTKKAIASAYNKADAVDNIAESSEDQINRAYTQLRNQYEAEYDTPKKEASAERTELVTKLAKTFKTRKEAEDFADKGSRARVEQGTGSDGKDVFKVVYNEQERRGEPTKRDPKGKAAIPVDAAMNPGWDTPILSESEEFGDSNAPRTLREDLDEPDKKRKYRNFVGGDEVDPTTEALGTTNTKGEFKENYKTGDRRALEAKEDAVKALLDKGVPAFVASLKKSVTGETDKGAIQRLNAAELVLQRILDYERDGIQYDYKSHVRAKAAMTALREMRTTMQLSADKKPSEKRLGNAQAPSSKTLNIWHSSGENAALSNLASRPFSDTNGTKYFSVEHAYQSWKSGKFDEATYKRYTKAGQKIVGNLGTKTANDWNIKLMASLIRRSFEQNPDAMKVLKATGDAVLTHTQDRGVWAKEFPRILMELRDLGISAGVTVVEHPVFGYRDRTLHNAKADVTMALAIDFTTAGERLTAKAAGKKLVQQPLGAKSSTIAEAVIAHMQKLGAKSLNVAGNGIYTLAEKGLTQEQVNDQVYKVLYRVHKAVGIEKIVTGGQTGVDIAGAIAARKLGVPVEVTMPKGFLQRDVSGKDSRHTQAQIAKQIEDGAKALKTIVPGEVAQKTVLLPLGTSGSGKSTWIKSLPKNKYTVISPDEMRIEFAGSIDDKSRDKEIYEAVITRATDALKRGEQVIIDSTNLQRDRRRDFIEAVKKATPDVNIQYKLMPLNPALAKQRIKADIVAGVARADVPDSTIDRHAALYRQMLEDIKAEGMTEYLGEARTGNAQNSAEIPGDKTLTEAEQQEVIDAVNKRLGGDIAKFTDKLFGTVAGKRVPLSADWGPGSIRIAINALNPMQAGMHEAMHEFFYRLSKEEAGKAMLAKLLAAANSASVVRQLERLLQNHPNALMQIKEGQPDFENERMAYMYQFWQAGALKIGPETETIFQKIANFIRQVTKLLSDDQQAELILQAFDDGKFSDATKTSVVAKVMMEDMNARRNMVDNGVALAMGPLGKARELVFTAHSILAESGIKEFKELANMFDVKQGERAHDSKQGMFEARKQMSSQFLNKLKNVLDKLEKKDAEAVLQALFREDGVAPKDMKQAAAYTQIRALYDELYDYVDDAGVMRLKEGMGEGARKEWEKIPKRKHYFGVVWDMMGKEAEFAADLVKYHQREIMERLKELGYEDYKESAKHMEYAQAIAQRLANAHGAEDLSEVESSLGFSPLMTAINERTLDWIKAPEMMKYRNQDLKETMTSAIMQAVKRAEYVRRFGNGAAVIKEKMLDGYTSMLAQKLDKLGVLEARKLAQKLTGTYNEIFVQDGVVKAKKDEELKLEDYGVTQAQVDKIQLEALKEIKPLQKAVMAMEGTLGHDISQTLRSMSNAMIVYQNFRLLSTTLFASMSDPLGIVIRGGEVDDAYQAMQRGFKEVWKRWKQDSGTDDATALAEMIGSVDAGIFAESLGQTYSSMYMSGKTKWLNDQLFKWNGMEAWNRGMRVGATQAAIKFIKKHLTKPNKDSERFLIELFGEYRPELADGELNYTDPMVQQAIMRWVDGAILSPNAAQRPMWASDPHYGLFFHMKQFTYSYHRTILSRAWNEAVVHGNATPALTLIVGYVPVVIAADAAKSIILSGGEEPYWMDKGVGSTLWHGMGRANLAGIPQIGLDSFGRTMSSKEGAIDATLEGAMGLAGPTTGWAKDWYDKPVGDQFVRSLPLGNVFSQVGGQGAEPVKKD